MSRAALPPGLHPFADSHDVNDWRESARKLKRMGATVVFPCVMGNNGHGPSDGALVTFDSACRDIDVLVVPFVFPALDGASVARARMQLSRAMGKIGAHFGMLDAEPDGDSNWNAAMLKPWLGMWPDLIITTTRHEAPFLGVHSQLVYAQLEQQNSLRTLVHAMEIFRRYSPPMNIVLTTGVFDAPKDPRTPEEVAQDLKDSAPQARIVKAHSLWSLHSLDDRECDLHREWALRTIA